jgi:hypothetical protein
MGLSNRIFLLDTSDNLYRVASVLFEQMLREPTSHRMTPFAGARVRMAHVLVECRQRQPTQVVWATFSMLTFDAAGVLNSAAYMHQQSARAESALAPGLAARNTSAIVVDAASRFIDHGGRWQPTSKVAQLLEQAALGRLKCPRLSS